MENDLHHICSLCQKLMFSHSSFIIMLMPHRSCCFWKEFGRFWIWRKKPFWKDSNWNLSRPQRETRFVKSVIPGGGGVYFFLLWEILAYFLGELKHVTALMTTLDRKLSTSNHKKHHNPLNEDYKSSYRHLGTPFVRDPIPLRTRHCQSTERYSSFGARTQVRSSRENTRCRGMENFIQFVKFNGGKKWNVANNGGVWRANKLQRENGKVHTIKRGKK